MEDRGLPEMGREPQDVRDLCFTNCVDRKSGQNNVRLQALACGKRRRRPVGRQSRDRDSPARSGAYTASLRDTNSVKSRTRFVLRVSPWVRSQSVPYMRRSVPGPLTRRRRHLRRSTAVSSSRSLVAPL